MSGELLVMARNGTTLLPGEARKLALSYDTLREKYHAALDQLAQCEERCAVLSALLREGQTALDAKEQTALDA